jgi:hypothetical protein
VRWHGLIKRVCVQETCLHAALDLRRRREGREEYVRRGRPDGDGDGDGDDQWEGDDDR